MKRSLSYALVLVIAFAGLASVQAGAQATTKPNPGTSANAAVRRNPPSTLSSNLVTRVVRRVAAAIGVGESEAEKAPVPASKRAANAQTVQATTRPVSNARANPNAGRAAAPKAPAADARSGALPLPAAPAADTAPRVLINREVFQYDGDGRRDPFVSLFTTTDLKPLLTDLKLVGVAYDPRGQNSVAVLRDVTSKDQYKVRVGQTIGRMRVAAIQPKAVIFTIEEFGYSRQELLPIAPPDSTKMRLRQ
jgi:hypothetical protein